MKDRQTANYLKAVMFDGPEWVPARVKIMHAAWMRHGEEMERVVLDHPLLFPGFTRGDNRGAKLDRSYRSGRWVDAYGITWQNIEEGLSSIPLDEKAPLADWNNLVSYRLPDLLNVDQLGQPIDWEERRQRAAENRVKGGLAAGSLWHGAMYMVLTYLRGFEGFMLDVAQKDPRLDSLIESVLRQNLRLIERWLETEIEIMHFGDDLGFQTALPIRPEDWRRYLKPCFSRMYGLCRNRNVLVYQHTDGYIMDIIPDLIDAGVDVLNPQIRPNTFGGLKKLARGKVAIDLDLDRQLFPFADDNELREHVRRSVEELAQPEGGLILGVEIEPDVPVRSVDTICRALEELGCKY